MVISLDAGEQGRDRHRAVTHVAFVRHVILDCDGPGLRVLEQFFGLPGATAGPQFQGQLRGMHGCGEQQGAAQEDKRFQLIAVPSLRWRAPRTACLQFSDRCDDTLIQRGRGVRKSGIQAPAPVANRSTKMQLRDGMATHLADHFGEIRQNQKQGGCEQNEPRLTDFRMLEHG